MGTQSTTSLLKKNIAAILKMEGQPLSIPAIREKLQARGITDYRQGHLAGSLHQILDMPGYISPERGCYSISAALRLKNRSIPRPTGSSKSTPGQ